MFRRIRLYLANWLPMTLSGMVYPPCNVWGHSITGDGPLTWSKKAIKTGRGDNSGRMKIQGFIGRTPRFGDEVQCNMQSGRIGRFVIVQVTKSERVHDRFTAKTEFLGYTDSFHLNTRWRKAKQNEIYERSVLFGMYI